MGSMSDCPRLFHRLNCSFDSGRSGSPTLIPSPSPKLGRRVPKANGHSRQKSLLCQHFRLALCDLSFGFGLFVLLTIVDAMPAFEFALQGVLSASHMRNAPDI